MPLTTDKDILELINTLKKSPTGFELVKFAEEHDVKIKIVDSIASDAVGVFDCLKNTVEIPSNFKTNVDRTIVTLAHELRHAWQLHNDLSYHSMQISTLDLTKFDAFAFSLFHGFLLERRFSEADAFSTSMQVAFELMDSKILPPHYMDGFDSLPDTLHHSFLNKIQENKDNLDSGVARRASFDAFFQKTSHVVDDLYYLSKCQIYDLSVFKVFNDISRLFVNPALKDLWKECVKTPEKRHELKNIFNTSAKDSRKVLPKIEQLNKYGHMEAGGNYLTDINGKSLHSDHYIGSDSDGKSQYCHTWKEIQKATKHVYQYKF